MGIAKNKHGFTIVELLIVIVVIGILAAITIVAFNGVQNRANDTAVKQDLKNFKTKMEAYRALNDIYPDGSALGAAADGWKASQAAYAVSPTAPDNLVYCYAVSDRSFYAVVALSKSGNAFYVSDTTGVAELPVAWDNVGTCTDMSASYANNWRGYASSDTGSGPWRSWTGVEN